uniref:PDZ domain-containing protein n=1 Tax=Elaeophora elaphi TaxID=1147741 RepID=A0A0R3RLI0_9BILA
MEGSGRVASRNLLRNLNGSTNGKNGGDRNCNARRIRQTSGTGYEGSSEGTQLKNLANISYDRRRSRSWQHHTQQLERSGPSGGLQPMYRGRRWRRRVMQKKARLANTSNAPPTTSSINTSTGSNNSISVKLPDQQQQWNSAPILLNGPMKEKPQQQQQKQHDRSTSGLFNEMKSDSIVKTCVINGNTKITFQVQLAHGSPTGIISGFNNITQLYQAIANCYDEISADDILYCTVNTHRISMDALLCSSIKINDLIFAHIAGQKKEVTLTKTESALGLTIADNGAGKAFIKRIAPATLTSKAKPGLEVGDFIEKINGESMVGRKHFDVARYLRALPIGSIFTIRLVEPKRTGFNFIASYTKPKRMRSILDTNETIRFKADGTIVVQEMPNELIINKMNDIFDSYFGFHDNDLAQTIWEMISSCTNFNDLKNVLKKSDINDFNFPTELYFDLWGTIDDYRNGRLGKVEMPLKKTANDGGSLPDEQKL